MPKACRTLERLPLELCKELALAGGKPLGASPSHGRETNSSWEGPVTTDFLSGASPRGKGGEVGPCEAYLTRRFLTGIRLSATV